MLLYAYNIPGHILVCNVRQPTSISSCSQHVETHLLRGGPGAKYSNVHIIAMTIIIPFFQMNVKSNYVAYCNYKSLKEWSTYICTP